MILLTPCGVKGFSYVCELVIKALCAVKSCMGGRGDRREGGIRRPRLLSSTNTTTCQGWWVFPQADTFVLILSG